MSLEKEREVDARDLAKLLEDRLKFDMLELPGQPRGMHMGTAYLVSNLARELKDARDALRSAIAEYDRLTAERERHFNVMSLEQEIQQALNRHCAENESNTPDFILAQYLLACLAAFNTATQQRETWYGRDARPSATNLA